MGIVKTRFKLVKTKNYWILGVFLGVMLLISKLQLWVDVSFASAQLWIFSCFNSITLVGYFLPLLYICLLNLLEGAYPINQNLVVRLTGRKETLRINNLTVISGAILIVIIYAALIIIFSLTDFTGNFTWSTIFKYQFIKYFNIGPNVKIPLMIQPILLLILLFLYLLMIGMIWNIAKLVTNKIWFSMVITILFVIINVYFFKNSTTSIIFNFLPVKYYVYYLGGAKSVISPIQIIEYWIVAIGSLAITLNIINKYKKLVNYES